MLSSLELVEASISKEHQLAILKSVSTRLYGLKWKQSHKIYIKYNMKSELNQGFPVTICWLAKNSTLHSREASFS